MYMVSISFESAKLGNKHFYTVSESQAILTDELIAVTLVM